MANVKKWSQTEAIDGNIPFELEVFFEKNLYPFPLATENLTGNFVANRQYGANCSSRLSFLNLCSDQRKVRTTGNLERPESRNDRKARTTGKPTTMKSGMTVLIAAPIY